MTAIAGTYNIIADQGSNFDRVLTYKDSSGNPINLTSYNARMQIRTTITSDEVILEATTSNGYITLGGVLGTITIAIPANIMNFYGSYSYDLEIFNGSTTTRVVMGTFTVRAEVTR